MRGLLALIAVLCASPLAAAETVTVFAAASLREALDEAVRPYEAATGNKVVVSYAASSALAKQIEAGAPATLFISADRDWVSYLDARGLVLPGTMRDLLRNDLVLIAPKASRAALAVGPHFNLAGALAGGRLAVADPSAVPAGKYAKAALESQGVWPSVQGRLAPAENVRGALAMVSSGAAPLGIVYGTDALADPGVRVVARFPSGTYPPIVYPMAELKGAGGAAHALARHLASPAVRAIWERHGFRAM